MSHQNEPRATCRQPRLDDLFADFLNRRAAAQTDGLAVAETGGDVVPFEAAPVQPLDPRLAWNEALAALDSFVPGAASRVRKGPSEWPSLVAAQLAVAALPFCAGNFPQMVRSLQPLMQAAELTGLRPPAAAGVAFPSLTEWMGATAHQGRYPEALLAVGLLRLAGQFQAASELVSNLRTAVPGDWKPALENEAAALAWHAGKPQEAEALWLSLPENGPVLFNRGLAALFLGDAKKAIPSLRRAVEQIPETSSWHHLGRLYLALAEMRG